MKKFYETTQAIQNIAGAAVPTVATLARRLRAAAANDAAANCAAPLGEFGAYAALQGPRPRRAFAV